MKKLILAAMLSAAALLGGCTPAPTDSIGEAKAKEIALAEVPGATEDNIRKFKLERDDGRLKYEGKIYYDEKEYEFDIDAVSGEILSFESESVYD